MNFNFELKNIKIFRFVKNSSYSFHNFAILKKYYQSNGGCMWLIRKINKLKKQILPSDLTIHPKYHANTVVVIEDDPVSLEIIRQHLSTLPLEIVLFQKSTDAYDYIKTHKDPYKFLCIITDIMMDSIDGIDIFELVKIKLDLSHVYFIFSTGADKSIISNCLIDYERTYYFKKPIDASVHDFIKYIFEKDNQKETL